MAFLPFNPEMKSRITAEVFHEHIFKMHSATSVDNRRLKMGKVNDAMINYLKDKERFAV